MSNTLSGALRFANDFPQTGDQLFAKGAAARQNAAGVLPKQDHEVPSQAGTTVKSGDTPEKLKWRALYNAAAKAGLPETECRAFAEAYHRTGIEWTDGDPSPQDGTKQIKSYDLKAGEKVSYKLTDGERTALSLRQTSYTLAGGKLGSRQELATGREKAQVKQGYDQAALRRYQVEQKLGTNGTNGVNGTGQTNAASQISQQQIAPTKTLSEYKAEALKIIEKNNGAMPDVRKRNDAISGAYASLYLKNPDAFVWPGAAAYASKLVGYSMDQAIAMPDMQEMSDPMGDFRASAGLAKLTTDNIREMLGKGNITIFESIYPASLAYQQGGIEELKRIESTLKDDDLKFFAPIRAAYEQIDDGIKLNKQQPGAGDQKIKEGTNALIDFEQDVILQPILDKYPNTVRLITPFAFGDLDADSDKTDWKTFTRFNMPRVEVSGDALQPIPVVRVSNYGKSFSNSDARRDWIKNEIFPKWDEQRKERFGEVQKHMQLIIETGKQAGGQY